MYLTPKGPNELVTTDLAGPFKVTNRGNQSIQVMVDHFTKHVVFFALKNTKASPVANNAVNGWCCKFGIPESILSDGGKQYQSKLLELLAN